MTDKEKNMPESKYQELRFDQLEQLIKDNHSSLTCSINEIKDNIKELFQSDRKQDGDLVRLETRIEYNEKELKDSMQSQKDHDAELSKKIDAVKFESRNDWTVFFKVAGFLLAIAGAVVGVMKLI